MARPICVHCGKPYGQRDVNSETVRWPVGEEMPPYRGNGIVTKVGYTYETAEKIMTCQRYVWDGETYWGGYKPFCTLRCALDYARRVYNERKAGGQLRRVV